MPIVTLPTSYYQQFDADLAAEIPAEGYGGWRVAHLPLNTDRTALVVMHAWDCGTAEEHPGWFRAVEYLPRSYRIATEVLPPLLSAVRGSGLRVFHVVAGRDYYSRLPGFATTDEPPAIDPPDQEDLVLHTLRRFRDDQVFPGTHNLPDIARGRTTLDFLPSAVPQGDEPVAATSAQLLAHCRTYGINHLIYTGFALDGCLLTSPGGMVDLSRAGLLCSTVREATTAIENKETARTETAKALALWRVALHFGFVYGAADLIGALAG
ncbi:hypothetical protein [Microlunatus speluncae]|uniref:hypothetical protein n=1 Tax=Microlunatus speluncae TaxID=2594267 RepID=UPI0012660B8B|nr:hypothetical protein [Microlunatus speluncae]